MTEHSVSFEFYGGPHDGLILAGPLGTGETTAAESLWRDSNGGHPGNVVWLPTPYAIEAIRNYGPESIEHLSICGYRFPGHCYEIFVKRHSLSSLILRARHVGVEE